MVLATHNLQEYILHMRVRVSHVRVGGRENENKSKNTVNGEKYVDRRIHISLGLGLIFNPILS